MKKILIGVFAALLMVVCCYADVTVDKKNHIQNMDPGRCAWCTLETLGRTHGWKELEGCRDRNNRAAYRQDMIVELDKYKIKYRVKWPKEGEHFYHVIYKTNEQSPQKWIGVRRSKEAADELMKSKKDPGSYWIEKRLHWDTSFLTKAVEDGLGAAVSVDYIHPPDPKPYQHSRHMLVLIAMNNDTVKFIDSNYSPGVIREETLAWFVTRWNGFAIAIEKKQ